MNPKDYLKTILKVKAGSHLYNLATKNSDEDYRGCVLCTHPKVLFGFHKFEQITSQIPDSVMWNLPKFVQLALQGNTVALEVLFAPPEYLLDSSEFGYFLRNNRGKFLSRRIFSVLVGYGYAEYNRAVGATTGKLGEKRKQEIEKFGYSPKNASHCIRLLKTGIILFNTGEYITSWNNLDKEELADLKIGKYSPVYFEKIFKYYMEELKQVFEKTDVFDMPDEKYIIDNTIKFMKNQLGAYNK
jgi:predicted nucleotidyltransferase